MIRSFILVLRKDEVPPFQHLEALREDTAYDYLVHQNDSKGVPPLEVFQRLTHKHLPRTAVAQNIKAQIRHHQVSNQHINL